MKIEKAKNKEKISKIPWNGNMTHCPDCGCATDNLGMHFALSCPFASEATTKPKLKAK